MYVDHSLVLATSCCRPYKDYTTGRCWQGQEKKYLFWGTVDLTLWDYRDSPLQYESAIERVFLSIVKELGVR